ncbi:MULTISPECIES: phytanoyl-CoA dioxygenase family protein [unclassified Mycobacterium]|uniref:phytanoyl-CoA dioxygenase family protein n=1 Tax=unclassified Mycobacterium TaxID=2642494 RepID=UPI0004117D60|nr:MULTISPECIES: phytanoyl-CoA dioxygenase family protein [unclassified Mycobacterium]
MIAALSAADVQRREFWTQLCPEMSIEAGGARPSAAVGELDTQLANLKREGYVQVPDALPEAAIAPIRAGVSTLFQQGIPLAFAFVYDELWLAFQGLSEFLSSVMGEGYQALPDFWVWHVNPNDNAVGWGPHRDKLINTLDDDNSPHTLTVWLPFTDATPLNGCMYMLPAHLDDRFVERRWDGPDNTVVRNLQDIRALPATAGTMFAWNQAVLHWGGRGSRLGAAPRISAAFEFQRSDCAPFNTPLLDPGRMPTFTERLGLIGKQVLQYRHMYPLAPEVEAIATVLAESYMPEVVASMGVGAAL